MQVITKSKTRGQTIGLIAFVLFGFLASGFLLKMNFTSQAPEGNWKEPWYNDCEETSIAIVDSFYNNISLAPAIAKKEILRIFAIKEKAFGPSLDENAEKMVNLINNFLNWKARIVENPTIEQIKEEINNNHPVILPTDGRKLNNRYYTTSEFHVFAISGYDDDKKMFIVQDPGTYHGHNYQYPYAIIENAMHDYNPVDLSKGRRVAIFTSQEIKNSESSGGDNNGVKKADELKNKTNLLLSDTSGNGSANGEAIKNNDLLVISGKSTEHAGLAKRISGYWVYLIGWIKKIQRTILGG